MNARDGVAEGRDVMGIEIKTVGIIGAGQMGSGIAHVCSLAGLDVRMNDRDPERLKNGLATVNGNLQRQVSKGAITEDQRRAAIERIQYLHQAFQ